MCAPIAHLDMNFVVAGAAEGDKVRSLTCTAVSQRKDVMHFLCGLDNTVHQALLAQRVGFYLSVTDSFPRSAVCILIIGTLVSVVEALRLHLVLRAVLFTRCGEAWTALVSARSVWFGRHSASSFRGNEKTARDCSQAVSFILFR